MPQARDSRGRFTSTGPSLREAFVPYDTFTRVAGPTGATGDTGYCVDYSVTAVEPMEYVRWAGVDTTTVRHEWGRSEDEPIDMSRFHARGREMFRAYRDRFGQESAISAVRQCPNLFFDEDAIQPERPQTPDWFVPGDST